MANAPDLRRQILDASVALIESEGLGALSLREVARRAGVSHQAPYHYFPDREAILAAIAHEGFSALRGALHEAAIADGADAIARLERGGRAYVQFAQANPAHFRVMFRPELVELEEHAELMAEAECAFAELEALVGGLVAERVIAAAEVPAMITLAWSFVHGFSSLVLDGPLARAAPDAPTEVEVFGAFSALLRARAGAGAARPKAARRVTRPSRQR